MSLAQHQRNWDTMQAKTYTKVERAGDQAWEENALTARELDIKAQELAIKDQDDAAKNKIAQNAQLLSAPLPKTMGSGFSLEKTPGAAWEFDPVSGQYGYKAGSFDAAASDAAMYKDLEKRGLIKPFDTDLPIVPGAANGMVVPKRIGGGEIRGPRGDDQVPAEFSDGQPARLEDGEVVLPKEAVDALGGPEAIRALVEELTGKQMDPEMKEPLPGQVGMVPGMAGGADVEAARKWLERALAAPRQEFKWNAPPAVQAYPRLPVDPRVHETRWKAPPAVQAYPAPVPLRLSADARAPGGEMVARVGQREMFNNPMSGLAGGIKPMFDNPTRPNDSAALYRETTDQRAGLTHPAAPAMPARPRQPPEITNTAEAKISPPVQNIYPTNRGRADTVPVNRDYRPIARLAPAAPAAPEQSDGVTMQPKRPLEAYGQPLVRQGSQQHQMLQENNVNNAVGYGDSGYSVAGETQYGKAQNKALGIGEVTPVRKAADGLPDKLSQEANAAYQSGLDTVARMEGKPYLPTKEDRAMLAPGETVEDVTPYGITGTRIFKGTNPATRSANYDRTPGMNSGLNSGVTYSGVAGNSGAGYRGATTKGFNEEFAKTGNFVEDPVTKKRATMTGAQLPATQAATNQFVLGTAGGRAGLEGERALAELDAIKRWQGQPDVSNFYERNNATPVYGADTTAGNAFGKDYKGVAVNIKRPGGHNVFGYDKKAPMPDWVADRLGTPRLGESPYDYQVRQAIADMPARQAAQAQAEAQAEREKQAIARYPQMMEHYRKAAKDSNERKAAFLSNYLPEKGAPQELLGTTIWNLAERYGTEPYEINYLLEEILANSQGKPGKRDWNAANTREIINRLNAAARGAFSQ
jgi:hypothetical protein